MFSVRPRSHNHSTLQIFKDCFKIETNVSVCCRAFTVSHVDVLLILEMKLTFGARRLQES